MKRSTLFLILLMAATLFLVRSPAASLADEFSIDKVQSDLSMKTAKVVQGPKEHLLLNQGRNQGVRKGDIWTLYLPAQQVKDLETGEKLGKFAPPAALVRVVQVHDQFSEIGYQCIKGKDCQISHGMKAIRFDRVKAWFIDKGGPFSHAYRQLNANLDHFDWQGYRQPTKQAPGSDLSAWGVVFVSSEDGLTVWSGGQVRKIYSVQEKGAARVKSEAYRNVPGTSAPLKAPDFAPVMSVEQEVDSMGLARSTESQAPYLIFLTNRQIRAKNLEKDKTFKYIYQGFGQVVDLSVSGNNLLAVNIYVPDSGMCSMLLEITDRGFQKKAECIEYVLSFMGSAHNKKKPILFGQRFSRKDLLQPVVYRLKIEEDGVSRRGRVDVPFGFSLPGAFLCDVNGNSETELGFFNQGGQMIVYEQGAQVWESREKFAPSHGSLLVSNPQNSDAAPSKVSIWGQPAVFSVKGQAYTSIPINEADFSSMLNHQPVQGTVGLFYGQNNMYQLQRLEDRFKGPILDLAVYENQLLICVDQGERSHVISASLSSLVSGRFRSSVSP
jgi:hypothetical protein